MSYFVCITFSNTLLLLIPNLFSKAVSMAFFFLFLITYGVEKTVGGT